jgi:uncharacterized protein YdeI (YjbR/CyaY-like superfamily)
LTPTFFPTPADLRKWFRKNHATATELWIGFYKVGRGKPSVTWPESVDEALCCGWIDGIRKTIDEDSYRIRFTPRRPRSVWSAVNIKRVKVLSDEKRMLPAGRKAFEARRENRSGIYSYEQRPQDLPQPYLGEMKRNKAAWAFFAAQPPSYRKVMTWFILSAKREETRLQRLKKLIDVSATGKRML